MNEYGEESGWEDEGEFTGTIKKRLYKCKGINHNPPDNLIIPVGKIYRHVCDNCTYVVRINSAGEKL